MRILIVRCGALGDLVYATSVIDALRYEYGEDTVIDFVTTPGSGTLFKEDKRIGTIFPLRHKKLPIFLSREKQHIVNHAKRNPYDILLNFEYGKQFQSLLQNICATKKIGATFQDITIEHINRAEMIKKYLLPVVSFNNIQKAYPRIATLDFKTIQKQYQLPNKYIVLAPSNSHIFRSGINYRAWPNQHWKTLMEQLSTKTSIVIVGAKGEEQFFQEFHPYPNNTIDLIGKNSVVELATVIQNAAATICTDSAIGHISAAVNTPVFVLMGPNDTTTDAPYTTPHNKVQPISLHLECSPCYKTEVMKRCKANICMQQITPQRVLESVLSANIL